MSCSKMKPNIVMVGFKKDWSLVDEEALDEYLDIIRYAFVLQNGGRQLWGCGWHRVGIGVESKKNSP